MTTKPTNPIDNFVDALVDELIAMPDDELLEGADPAAVRDHGLQMLRAAALEAGRRRLAAARAGAALAQESRTGAARPEVSPDEARRYLAKVSNDPKFTLAARNLSELSDEEVLRLYEQARSLENKGRGET